MSNPNYFRISFRDASKSSKDKPHIKYVLNAMRGNFNPALKDGKDPADSERSESIVDKSDSCESSVDSKNSKKITSTCNSDPVAELKSGKKNNPSNNINVAEPCMDNKIGVKGDATIGNTTLLETAENKVSTKKNSSIGKNSFDGTLDAKSTKKDSALPKSNMSELTVDKKSVGKKETCGNKTMKTAEMVSVIKPEVIKKRTEKKSETVIIDPENVNNCKVTSVGSGPTTPTPSSCSNDNEDINPMGTDVQTPDDSPPLAKEVATQGSEERKKRIARKRALRNRSSTRSEGGSEADAPTTWRKRSARRWSKEGESVLQNAIARKEKSLSSIGKSDEDKTRVAVRNLRDSRNSLPDHKRSHNKSQDSTSASPESSSDVKGKSAVSPKLQINGSTDMVKKDNETENSETGSDTASKISIKQEAENPCTHTKTGKRRYKPFRGLRYSFSGVTKRSKVIRRSAPSQRNFANYFNELTMESSNSSTFKSATNSLAAEKSRSNSPAVADACTSKSKKNRRDNTLSPSPSPGDTPADANHPESTAISIGAGTAGLCLCQSKTNLYVRKDAFEESDLSLMCQAVDSLEGRLIGCCNAVGGSESARLYRPSPRVPYIVVCEQHRQRLLRHHCCPGCGNYCTQGRFVQCPALHYYHRDCQLLIAGNPQCPHCGLDSPPNEVSISLGVQKYPVFLPHQKLVKQTPSARMSLVSSTETLEQLESPPVNISMTLPIATTVLDKGEREKYSAKHLYQSAKSGDAEKIVQIIRHGINPNHIYREISMRTALHAASEKGHMLAVHVLVQAGAQLDPQDSELMTPTMLACLNGHLRVVQYLVKAGACVTHQGSDGMTALHIAAKRGDLEICHCLLTTGKAPLSYIDVKDDGGWTALVWSCEFRHVAVASYLLDRRADALLRDSEENIALHWAAFSGSEEISEKLLNHGSSVNSVNIHGDSPLHVAARQDNLQCVLLFLTRGARPDIVNGIGQHPLDCSLVGSDCYNAINTTAELRKMTSSAKERTNRILTNDITRGKEESEIQCLNAVDEEAEPRDYVYVTENCFTSNIHVDRAITSLQSCECEDTCIGTSCKCTQLSLQSWYDAEGKLLPEFNFFDPPMLFECNEMCSCNVKLCRNRVVQRGLKVRFQLFRTVGKGWGVRTLTFIPKGTYVCEYIGEIISDCEADQREDDSYLFDLDNRDGETYCIDACRYGNIARFINHMCAPNLQPVRVFMGHHDLHFPRIAFFANRDIEPQEELGFDYGDKFWIIKYKSFTCTCGAPNCKYSEISIKQTLAEYNRKQEEELVT
ncbi:histone-lysine N-methyltransferase EHMT2 isoform X2 [Thrips palmi]|uniref:Histone-lysine N-methyltransferase EHMT2 isoform X2 n=1 Tax=Thrips palmi TaxID=161013 RepID=A0A6P8ZA41_THRPL|nr:histone-lysine N-methyltransferase EHMT2 isoform X2 [Thrips palmi]